MPKTKDGEWRSGEATDAAVLKLLKLHRRVQNAVAARDRFLKTLPDAHRLTYAAISDDSLASALYMTHVSGHPTREAEMRNAAAQMDRVGRANPRKKRMRTAKVPNV